MSFLDRLWASRYAFYGTVMDSGVRYLVLAGFFWLFCHVLFAGWLAKRHISRKRVPFGQMSWEFLNSIRSVLIYGVVGVLVYILAHAGWLRFYGPMDKYG